MVSTSCFFVVQTTYGVLRGEYDEVWFTPNVRGPVVTWKGTGTNFWHRYRTVKKLSGLGCLTTVGKTSVVTVIETGTVETRSLSHPSGPWMDTYGGCCFRLWRRHPPFTPTLCTECRGWKVKRLKPLNGMGYFPGVVPTERGLTYKVDVGSRRTSRVIGVRSIGGSPRVVDWPDGLDGLSSRSLGPWLGWEG